jgi:hypothetical protein
VSEKPYVSVQIPSTVHETTPITGIEFLQEWPWSVWSSGLYCCIVQYKSTNTLEAIHSSETLVQFYWNPWYYNPEKSYTSSPIYPSVTPLPQKKNTNAKVRSYKRFYFLCIIPIGLYWISFPYLLQGSDWSPSMHLPKYNSQFLTLYISTLKMEAAFSSKTKESAYKAMWHHNLEDHMMNLRLYCNRN